MENQTIEQLKIERRTKMEQQEKNEKLLNKHKTDKTEYSVSYGQKLSVILHGRMKELIDFRCANPTKRDAFIREYLIPNIELRKSEKDEKVVKFFRTRDLCDEIAQTVSMNITGSLSKGLTKNNIMAGIAKDILFIVRAPFDDNREKLRNEIIGFIDSIITNAGLGRKYEKNKDGEIELTSEEEAAHLKIYEFKSVNKREYFLFLEDSWLEVIKRATDSYIRPVSNYPIMVCKPVPHLDLVSGNGGYLEINSPLLKYPVRGTDGKIHPLIADFTAENYPDWFAAINRSQETAYCVNKKLLDVLEYFHATDRSFKDYPYSLIDASEEEERQEAYVAEETKKDIDKRNSDRKSFSERFDKPYSDLKQTTVTQAERKFRAIYKSKRGKAEGIILQAREYKAYKELFFPSSVDYRGRRYPYANTGLSYQGGEMAKALLQFANKKVLSKKGVLSLFEYLGNCITVDGVYKLDKKVRRVKAAVAKQWFVANQKEFMKGNFEMFIDEQDKFEEPITALAIVMELVEWCRDPEGYKSGYVLHQDARCSGGAIIGTSLRDEKVMKMTSIVDYTDEDEYLGDLYGMVADSALVLCVERSETDKLCEDLLEAQDVLFTRGMFKDPVMTKSNYGATDYRVRKQSESSFDWEGEGFTHEHKQAFDSITLDALASALPSCTSFLGAATEAVGAFMYKEFDEKDTFAKVIAITNPLNSFPIVHKEYSTDTVPVNTTVNGKRLRLNLISRTPDINVRGMISAFAPNLVHGADSSLLSLVETQCDFDLALIHDSVGSHPNDAGDVVVSFSNSMKLVSDFNPLQMMVDCLGTGVVIPMTNTFTGEWKGSAHCLV